jgi:MFS family permease
VLPAGIGRFGTLAIYAAIAVNGVVRAFLAPVYMSLFARVLKREQFPRGAGISSVVMQTGLVLGPALGGILVAWGGKTTAYLIAAIFAAAAADRRRHAACLRAPAARRTRAGVQEHWRGPALRLQHAGSSGGAGAGHVLGAVRRRGGLLPAFINEILHLGPEALGLLRASPAAGAVLMGLYLARHPLQRHAGRVLLLAVAGFRPVHHRIRTVAAPVASALMLMLSGMCDGVSVVLRSTILQLATPDHMRGGCRRSTASSSDRPTNWGHSSPAWPLDCWAWCPPSFSAAA